MVGYLFALEMADECVVAEVGTRIPGVWARRSEDAAILVDLDFAVDDCGSGSWPGWLLGTE